MGPIIHRFHWKFSSRRTTHTSGHEQTYWHSTQCRLPPRLLRETCPFARQVIVYPSLCLHVSMYECVRPCSDSLSLCLFTHLSINDRSMNWSNYIACVHRRCRQEHVWGVRNGDPFGHEAADRGRKVEPRPSRYAQRPQRSGGVCQGPACLHGRHESLVDFSLPVPCRPPALHDR